MNMVETKGKTVNESFRVVAVIQVGLPQNKIPVVRHVVVVDYVAFRQGNTGLPHPVCIKPNF